jgi:hypothetical protein
VSRRTATLVEQFRKIETYIEMRLIAQATQKTA